MASSEDSPSVRTKRSSIGNPINFSPGDTETNTMAGYMSSDHHQRSDSKNPRLDLDKYKTLIHNNAVIRPESPCIMRLCPKIVHTGNVTRHVVGQKCQNKPNKTVLLVGETGSGKSTFINALLNFAIGVKWEQDFWFEMIETDSRNPSDSQTSAVTMYEINEGDLGFSLTIIDTPGLGDTRGTDKLLNEQLLELLSSDGGVSEIHAVGLIQKATVNRLSDRVAYIFNSVTSLFSKNMEDKVVALFTHSDGRKPTKALDALETVKIKCARNEKNEPVHFLFDNCQRDDRTEDTKYLELADETTMRNMQSFMDYLQQQEIKNLTETVDVLKKRISLRECTEQLKDQVKLIKDKEEQIHKTEKAIEKYDLKIQATSNFQTEEIEIYKIKEDIDSGFLTGAVCCLTCEKNCHYPGCTWAWSPYWCKVMENGRCIVCECPVENHVKENWKYKENVRKVTKINQEMKEMHEQRKEKKDKKIQLLDRLRSEISDIKKKKNQFLEEAFSTIMQLEKIALNVDSVFTQVHLEFLIAELKKNKDTEKVHKLEMIRDRMDENIKAGAEYLSKYI